MHWRDEECIKNNRKTEGKRIPLRERNRENDDI
jgi:hypothetical protein